MSTTEPAPIACTLERSVLTSRIQAWQQVMARATSRRLEEDRLVATYPDDPQLLEQLRELIAAEAACCPFLEFDLERREGVVVSEFRFPAEAPEEMRTAILALVGAVDATVEEGR